MFTEKSAKIFVGILRGRKRDPEEPEGTGARGPAEPTTGITNLKLSVSSVVEQWAR